ncbi:bifunctional protein-disulfide isomerase/oxidoreductase DsbC [Rheinheimera baltica]|uniref:bifunctional protein-disulfide isomerase/oxidoreductase DsbC n=1 Tax=Rheinheimera baltica TaxID=67576 RepID=UPI002740271A|nr:bifunctional protein-disulfide isomerase/oxidoreductase DsbC [Rheinheimera baltica]MDP5144438.1 bifunctional protein-disulfide isomerase/oxidoreductase DsbC [Rheinheimera baltica]MDP5151753.1 bifunctional protein-disulfide isomerase/oxidoreductase DsbC [Rheinheimera baltica]
MKKFVIALCSLGLIASAQAQQKPDGAQYEKVHQLFSQLNLSVNAVADAPIDGIVQVFTNRGLFFASQDGQYFIEGKILDMSKRELLNDSQMRPYIQQQLADSKNDVIEYKAKDEKYVVNVFTDPSCGYCRKLHNDMQGYNDNGITVRYLAFPRGGLGSDTYLQMQNIWCTKDSRGALDAAKEGKKVAAAMCENPVKSQYEMGQSFGISGTPAIILPNGRLIPGYQPPKQLLSQLESGS